MATPYPSLHTFDFALLRSPLQSLQLAYDPVKHIAPAFEEGLYLASADFWNELQKAGSLNDKDRAKLGLTLDKYWIRSCTRSTPYGTFAGCAVIDIPPGPTNITLNPSSSHTKHIRIDSNYLTAIIQAITKTEPVARRIRLYANNSLYRLADSFRYVEYAIKQNIRKYQISSIDNSDYIASLLRHAASGATIEELTTLLIGLEDVSHEEATQFVMELWNSQLLVSELEPRVTGIDPLYRLIDQLYSLQTAPELVKKLQILQAAIKKPEEGVPHYREIEQQLANLGLAVQPPKNTLQTDLYLSIANANINTATIGAIAQQTSDLLVFCRPKSKGLPDEFKIKFLARYDDREIPLSLALDPEHGVGYTDSQGEIAGENEIVENLGITPQTAGPEADTSFTRQYILNKYIDHIRTNSEYITITDGDIQQLKKASPAPNIANSLFLIGSLLINDRGHFGNSPINDGGQDFSFVFDTLGFPSAASWLGRFAHGDSRLTEKVQHLLKTEEAQHPDAIYAEIVHLPNARTGNVILRPVLRSYEIPYVGLSGADPASHIPVGDLYVSILNDEIILRSKKLGKRVIPRLTTAHNFRTRSLPVYQFLCDLQSQGFSNTINWDWGLLRSQKNLPRVVYKNIVLQKAIWKLDLTDITNLPPDTTARVSWFRELRTTLKLPERVLLTEEDNQLLIDFEQPSGINLLLHYLNRRKNVLLTEFLFDTGNCAVKDQTGMPFTNELIIPLFQEPAPTGIPLTKKFDPASTKRKFPPNSEWLYFSIYCGVTTADKLLRATILPFVEKRQLFEQFFFVRYKDDQPHLRIRFFNSNTSLQLSLYKEFLNTLQPFLDNGTIHRIVLDTYVRELERYGGHLTQAAERLFNHDSLAVLRFISLIDGEVSDKYRLLFALRSIDMFLDDFSLPLPEKIQAITPLQSGYFSEFGAHPELRQRLNEKYRKYQPQIFSHMDPSKDADNDVTAAVAIFRARSDMNRPVIDGIQDLPKETIFTLLQSYIHMSMNRLFVDHQRKHELVVYHFLEKYYTSQKAIRSQH